MTAIPLRLGVARKLRLLALASIASTVAVCRAEPQVFRTFMPEAGPSAFGVVLGPELVLCYDYLRGGVNQAWRGSLDLAPTWKAKINQPAKISGSLFYAESLAQPLRVGDPATVPIRRLKGYRLDKDTVTFDFTLDGVKVSETLRTLDADFGIERTWAAPSGAVLFFHAEEQPHAAVTFDGGNEITPRLWRHEGGAGKMFIMRIRPKKGS